VGQAEREAGSGDGGGGGGDFSEASGLSGEGEAARTAYSAARLRGARRSRESSLSMAGGRLGDLDQLDPHAMVIPEPYPLPDPALASRPGGDPNSQPFAVVVHPDVAFVCDFHAHLADSEIIGLLGTHHPCHTLFKLPPKILSTFRRGSNDDRKT
jgi:hypothetical protein